jgi:lipopolysaccharide export system permease protein
VVLQYTVPLSVLCATVLTFGRMSQDNEITAMRGSGVGLWQIIAPALLLSVGVSAFCLYLQVELAPRCHFLADQLLRREGGRNPMAFLGEGVVRIAGHVVYIGQREGERLEQVTIYGFDDDGRQVRDISAKSGVVEVDEEASVLRLRLRDAVITTIDPDLDPGDPEHSTRIAAGAFTFNLDVIDSLSQRSVTRRVKHMTLRELFACLQVYREKGLNATPVEVDLQTRLSLGLSPVAFLLIGITFGMRGRRSETSVGLFLSVALGLFFYAFIVLSRTLKYETEYRPEILVWIPNLLYQVGGILGLRTCARA